MSHPTRFRYWLILLGVALSALATHARSTQAETPAEAEPADKPKQEIEWVRLLREKGQPLALQTAIVRYKPIDVAKAGVVVDLIGAIHIGDESYYDALNRQFEEYDVVLYELVAPEGTKIEPGNRHRGGHPVSAMQNGMKDMLKLEHQLERIDYSKKNFIHADMSPDEFAKSMTDRGEGFGQMFFKMMGMSLAEQSRQQAQGKSTDADLLMAFFMPDRALRMKRIMAEQFSEMESLLVGFAGPEGSTIITERNKKALEVLTRELGKGHKKIGIFYGAGHMEDMHERLLRDFQLQPTKTFWVDAWDLRGKK